MVCVINQIITVCAFYVIFNLRTFIPPPQTMSEDEVEEYWLGLEAEKASECSSLVKDKSNSVRGAHEKFSAYESKILNTVYQPPSDIFQRFIQTVH